MGTDSTGIIGGAGEEIIDGSGSVEGWGGMIPTNNDRGIGQRI